ncbi:MAG TPA: hypothetical protein VH092_34805 [Urbifossiella sp.]|jgi:hypothetical protein|nr:hypothetical protein [Urbifossiella sp.]
MSIQVVCGCGKRLRVGDEAVGKRVRCPACQAVLTVPTAEAPAPPPPPPAAPLDLDDEPEPRPGRRPNAAAAEPSVDRPEDRPARTRPRPGEPDKPDEDRRGRAGDPPRPRKKIPLAVKLGLGGCGGCLLLVLIGAGVIGYILYSISRDADRIVGVWERDDPGANPVEMLRKFPFTRLELETKEKRFAGTILFGASVNGRWSIVRSPGNGLIGINVQVTEKKGPDGKAMATGKDEVMGFYIKVIDTDHLEVSAAGTNEWAKFRRAGGAAAAPGGAAGAGELPAPVATLPADVLFKDGEKYNGKCVVVVARVPRIRREEHPGGRVEVTVDLRGDNGRTDSTAEFKGDEWAKVPKLEDAVRYEIMGLYEHRPQLSGKLTQCRYVGRAKSEAPEPVASLTVPDLIKGAATYRDKPVVVKGAVGTVIPTAAGGSLTLSAPGGGTFVVCLLAGEPFAVALKAGRGAEIEVQGIATGTGTVTLNDCRVTKSQPVSPVTFSNFIGPFAESAEKADAAFKDKTVTLTAKVDAVGDGRLTLGLGKAGKSKSGGAVSVIATFGPDWKDHLTKLRVGELVVVSGVYQSYAPREVTLGECWLLPRDAARPMSSAAPSPDHINRADRWPRDPARSAAATPPVRLTAARPCV